MSKAVVRRLSAQFGDRILGTNDFRGDDEVTVAPKDWREVALFLRDDPETRMNHFGDLTAVDFPEREGPRFDVILYMRSVETKARVRVRVQVADGQELDSLVSVWVGADWAEREVYDMFGIRFADHPDLRRILMYEEFEGFPLRKDYPIDRVQPLVPYRDVPEVRKLEPFGIEEGQPFARISWEDRLAGRDTQVSPAIGVQVGQRRTLSDSEVAEEQSRSLAGQAGASAAESGD